MVHPGVSATSLRDASANRCTGKGSAGRAAVYSLLLIKAQHFPFDEALQPKMSQKVHELTFCASVSARTTLLPGARGDGEVGGAHEATIAAMKSQKSRPFHASMV